MQNPVHTTRTQLEGKTECRKIVRQKKSCNVKGSEAKQKEKKRKTNT